jgi:hypothetical protein
MMEYYYDNLTERFGDNGIKIFFGKELGGNDNGFANMLANGSFYDENVDNATGVGKWDNNSNTKAFSKHHDHWHITAPVNVR